MYKHLRWGKHRYRKGYGAKRNCIPNAVSIELHPAVADERSRLGDWEADLVLGAQGTGVIAMLSSYKDVCHSITFDNGGEFSEHRAIAEILEVETYFAPIYIV